METLYPYPLHFQFKVAAFAPQFSVTDAAGKQVAYIRQKLFKFKEDVSVFRDETQSETLYKIRADRWIDWSASYAFTDGNGTALGKVGRKGGKSLFKAHYELFDEREQQDLLIREERFFVRFMDGLLGEVPVLGMLTGYFFNPTYLITRPDGTLVARFSKQPSFFGRKFQVEQESAFEPGEEVRILLGLMMMVLLERRRG